MPAVRSPARSENGRGSSPRPGWARWSSMRSTLCHCPSRRNCSGRSRNVCSSLSGRTSRSRSAPGSSRSVTCRSRMRFERARFRADLFYRLNVVEFRLPSLRERPAAVIPLAHQLLRTSATAACQGVTAISPAALEVMIKYRWPGNVRELRNVIERAAALASGPVIQFADLPESIRGSAVPAVKFAEFVRRSPLFCRTPRRRPPRRDDDEASRILAVLRKHNNNRRRAATELGISRVALYKKLHRYGLFVSKSKRTVQPLAAG